jgi:hypothetical protein
VPKRDQTDAVVPVTVGTVVWGVALVVTFLLRDRLQAHSAGWWVWTCAVGFGLGLFGCWWVRRRRARLEAAAAAAPSTTAATADRPGAPTPGDDA